MAVLKTAASERKWFGRKNFAAPRPLGVCPTRPGTLLGTLGPISLAPTRISETKTRKGDGFSSRRMFQNHQQTSPIPHVQLKTFGHTRENSPESLRAPMARVVPSRRSC